MFRDAPVACCVGVASPGIAPGNAYICCVTGGGAIAVTGAGYISSASACGAVTADVDATGSDTAGLGIEVAFVTDEPVLADREPSSHAPTTAAFNINAPASQ